MIKQRIRPMLGFKRFDTAAVTIRGIELTAKIAELQPLRGLKAPTVTLQFASRTIWPPISILQRATVDQLLAADNHGPLRQPRGFRPSHKRKAECRRSPADHSHLAWQRDDLAVVSSASRQKRPGRRVIFKLGDGLVRIATRLGLEFTYMSP
jgi:hypothetical protein